MTDLTMDFTVRESGLRALVDHPPAGHADFYRQLAEALPSSPSQIEFSVVAVATLPPAEWRDLAATPAGAVDGKAGRTLAALLVQVRDQLP